MNSAKEGNKWIDGKVLIDTWWNVNMYVRNSIAKNNSFNRYMGECE